MSNDQENAIDSKAAPADGQEIELSLDDLGRAYAEAIGLPPRKAIESGLADVDDPRDEAAADNAPCPISAKSILEAAVFLGSPESEKLTTRKIASIMRDVTEKEIRTLVQGLNREYEEGDHALTPLLLPADVRLPPCFSVTSQNRYPAGQQRDCGYSTAGKRSNRLT